jgi:PadR family transcriptional regulator PadR
MENRIDKEHLRGHLESMVMSVLEKKSAHGFEIMQSLEEQGCQLLQLKEGTLYPALYRLEEAGYILGKWENNLSERRGPRRRIYTLTKKGKKELASQRENWKQFVTVVGKIVTGNI